ncbi:MAG: radical SAM protein [Myxococcales bacterium]|nr:radical SAM protein [Myxococcales bacterium]
MIVHATVAANVMEAPSLDARNQVPSLRASRVRFVPLDGAWLAFDRDTGTRWLVRSEATRSVEQRAPLLALFSPSHACNLACSFCYRDPSVASVWTVDRAFEMLSRLSDEGTLEVAFGGGEPFAYKGFVELATRLATETPLVVHATTNGTLVTRDNARALRGHVREFRVSAYDATPWRRAVELLAGNGFSTGVHWLVTPERARSVRAFAREALALGARKLFLLSYHGDDRSMHLDRESLDALAEEIRSLSEFPIEIGLSACWGDRLEPIPKLVPDRGADCGAGDLFVSIGPDGRVSPCSFHHQRRLAHNGDEVLDAWRALRNAGPARAPGCRRTQIQPSLRDGVFRWRAYSGNNSVDCLVVGRFATPGVAEDAVRELRAIISEPQRDLLAQAWEGYRDPRVAFAGVRGEDQRTAAVIAEEQLEIDDAWIREVATWENPPSAVTRYARALGAEARASTLRPSIEDPDVLLSFGTLAIYDQGTTLEPFRDLAWLWALRGGRVYDVSRERTIVWAALASSDEAARECAASLDGVHRGASVWGTVDLGQWSPQRAGVRPELRIVALRRALEERGLRYEADLVRGERRVEIDVERTLASLRRKPREPVVRLRVDSLGPESDACMTALERLSSDPSTMSEWARQRLSGSRRWPVDFAFRRYGRALFVEAERMPFILGRGLVLRDTNTPWTVEARDVRLTVGLIEDEPASRAAARLRSFGLTPTALEDERRATIDTDDPLAVLDRIAKVVDRRDTLFTASMRPTDPIRAAFEHVQWRLGVNL